MKESVEVAIKRSNEELSNQNEFWDRSATKALCDRHEYTERSSRLRHNLSRLNIQYVINWITSTIPDGNCGYQLAMSTTLLLTVTISTGNNIYHIRANQTKKEDPLKSQLNLKLHLFQITGQRCQILTVIKTCIRIGHKTSLYSIKSGNLLSGHVYVCH